MSRHLYRRKARPSPSAITASSFRVYSLQGLPASSQVMNGSGYGVKVVVSTRVSRGFQHLCSNPHSSIVKALVRMRDVDANADRVKPASDTHPRRVSDIQPSQMMLLMQGLLPLGAWDRNHAFFVHSRSSALFTSA